MGADRDKFSLDDSSAAGLYWRWAVRRLERREVEDADAEFWAMRTGRPVCADIEDVCSGTVPRVGRALRFIPGDEEGPLPDTRDPDTPRWLSDSP